MKKSKTKAYIRKEIYDMETILSHADVDFGLNKVYNKRNEKKYVDLDGDFVKINSQRYQLFKHKGCTCVKCGLVGTYFAKEKAEQDARYHLNLYGKNSEGEEIMLTKDHIIPKSLGGLNHLSNYQTMCKICNEEKGNQIEEDKNYEG